VGVARAYAIANTIIAYPVLLMAHRTCGLNIARSVSETAPLLLAALIMGAVVWLVGLEAQAVGITVHGRLVLKVAIGALVYVVCLRQLARPTYSDILTYLAT
jgi:hypothetical protein